MLPPRPQRWSTYIQGGQPLCSGPKSVTPPTGTWHTRIWVVSSWEVGVKSYSNRERKKKNVNWFQEPFRSVEIIFLVMYIYLREKCLYDREMWNTISVQYIILGLLKFHQILLYRKKKKTVGCSSTTASSFQYLTTWVRNFHFLMFTAKMQEKINLQVSKRRSKHHKHTMESV